MSLDTELRPHKGTKSGENWAVRFTIYPQFFCFQSQRSSLHLQWFDSFLREFNSCFQVQRSLCDLLIFVSLIRAIDSNCPVFSICDAFTYKCPLFIISIKGHWVTYFYFSYYITILRGVYSFCPFCSICEGYREKCTVPVIKVKDHRLTNLHFSRYINLICVNDAKTNYVLLNLIQ